MSCLAYILNAVGSPGTNRSTQGLHDPGVDAQLVGDRDGANESVEFRAEPQIQFPRDRAP